jgi:hypothetical protein
VSDNLSINEPTAEQLAAATAALAAGPQPTAPVVEAPVVVEAPAPVVEAPVVDEKVDFWANSWFSRNKQ